MRCRTLRLPPNPQGRLPTLRWSPPCPAFPHGVISPSCSLSKALLVLHLPHYADMQGQDFKAIRKKGHWGVLRDQCSQSSVLKFQIPDNSLGPNNVLTLLWCHKIPNIIVQWRCGYVCTCLCMTDRQPQPFTSVGPVDRTHHPPHGVIVSH